MKKYVLLLLVAVLFGSCKRDDYLSYDKSLAAMRFVYSSYGNDSTVYSFALHPDETEGEVEIGLKLIGLAASVDREYGVEVVQKETSAKENTHFSIVDKVLPSDALTCNMKIKVMKTADLDAQDMTITLCLCGNENFASAPIDAAIYRIILTNQLAEPTGWPFGDYSKVKHEFVIKVTGVATDYDQWDTSELLMWTNKLNEALYEYNKEHPTDPLRDEDGMLITF